MIEKGLAIRFDGPPSHESGRFIEVEIDGASVNVGDWKEQGDGTWLLVFGEEYAEVARRQAVRRMAEKLNDPPKPC